MGVGKSSKLIQKRINERGKTRMKKIFAVVLAVAMLASIGGVAMAENYEEVGHGALSGPHYNLNIIGVPHGKSADMTGTQGHTIFVNLKGRTKIYLYNSDDPANECAKDFVVLDRNGTDGRAEFCLPEPEVDPDECGEGYSEVSYTVYARALGTPGGKSFTTTCAYDPDTDETVCSSITMKLERNTGKSKFTDVSKYLLFIYIDGVRHPLFDDKFEDFFWRYDNNGLKLAQLRFYLTPTCVPDTAPYMSIDPACGIPNSTVVANVSGVDTDFSVVRDVFIVGKDGLEATEISASVGVKTVSWFTLTLDIAASAPLEENTIYITDKNRETMSVSFTVDDSC
jgi:hypothetical protein